MNKDTKPYYTDCYICENEIFYHTGLSDQEHICNECLELKLKEEEIIAKLL